MEKMEMCRACLKGNGNLISLFELYEHDLSLAVILQTCMAVEVYQGDNLPPYLCDKCIQILTQFYNFTIIYEQSDEHLKTLLGVSFKKEPKPDLYEQGAADQKPHNDSNFQFLQSGKPEPHSQDDNGESFSTLQYQYDGGNNHSDPNDAHSNMDFITLDAIKAENLELEICNEYADGMQIQNIIEREVPKPKRIFHADNEVYEELVKYECTLCGEEHLYITAFRNHMRVKHSVFHVNPSEYCSTIQIKVPKSEPTVEELNQAHEDVLCGEPTFPCPVCNKKFHFAAQLNKHKKIHELAKKFICEICGAGFIRKTYLDDHKEGHSSERKHACPFCNKKFRRRTVLRAHKRSHTHRNHYVCELCGRAFTGKGTLRTHHFLIHVRERNFMCMICHQKFPLKSTLNKHVLRHEKREKGEKGFNCTECTMEYRDKSSLKRHVEVKHLGNVVLVPCPDCPKEYTSNANLMKHRKRHHPTEI